MHRTIVVICLAIFTAIVIFVPALILDWYHAWISGRAKRNILLALRNGSRTKWELRKDVGREKDRDDSFIDECLNALEDEGLVIPPAYPLRMVPRALYSLTEQGAEEAKRLRPSKP